MIVFTVVGVIWCFCALLVGALLLWDWRGRRRLERRMERLVLESDRWRR